MVQELELRLSAGLTRCLGGGLAKGVVEEGGATAGFRISNRYHTCRPIRTTYMTIGSLIGGMSHQDIIHLEIDRGVERQNRSSISNIPIGDCKGLSICPDLFEDCSSLALLQPLHLLCDCSAVARQLHSSVRDGGVEGPLEARQEQL